MSVFRSAFIALSHNRPLRRFSENSLLAARFHSRFIAGTTIEDALRVATKLNHQGVAVTLDSLGESVTSEAEARRAAAVYDQLIDAISARNLNANISLKLTQMGLEHSPELAESITNNLAERASCAGTFVRVDMEDSRRTQITLDIVRRIHSRSAARGAIGAVIQAYLYRSQADVGHLLAEGIRIRLCKGAYDESHKVAFPKKADVDRSYIELSRILLGSTTYHALATHDPAMIDAATAYATSRGIGRDHFEFQMLYGVRRDLQQRLVREGYRVRVYVPFGTAWYPYFMRRLAERPANVLFLARNLLRA